MLPSNLEAAIFGHGLKTYVWIDLVVAAILLIAGTFVMFGSEIARWVGIVAGVSAIWSMPYYPVWPFVPIACGHGGVRAGRPPR
ncbi:MAG: hypothetical protein ACLP62_01325 [Acidimicrobiales bacterium]